MAYVYKNVSAAGENVAEPRSNLRVFRFGCLAGVVAVVAKLCFCEYRINKRN